MERALKIIDQLHLVSIVCVFDQAIYSKACEIKWKEAEKFQNCVLMLGIFHLLMMYMGILNKRFSDAGLKDALIQSSILLKDPSIVPYVESVTIGVSDYTKPPMNLFCA